MWSILCFGNVFVAFKCWWSLKLHDVSRDPTSRSNWPATCRAWFSVHRNHMFYDDSCSRNCGHYTQEPAKPRDDWKWTSAGRCAISTWATTTTLETRLQGVELWIFFIRLSHLYLLTVAFKKLWNVEFFITHPKMALFVLFFCVWLSHFLLLWWMRFPVLHIVLLI